MRNAMLTALVVVAVGSAANAQFSLLPQVGFENSKTNITYNDLNSFSPAGVKFSPLASLKLDYKFKQGHGIFLGISSTRSSVNFSFSDPETGRTAYNASAGEMQLRFESGYQFNSRPIFFNKSSRSSSNKTVAKTTAKKSCGSQAMKIQCGKTKTETLSSRCGSSNKTKQVMAKNKGSWMRIQPSVGLAYIPASKTEIESKMVGGQPVYTYKAGNWNTGLIAGAGFEFGRSNNRLFTISINYYKGIGNLKQQTLTTITPAKTTITQLDSEASGWSMKVGIPFSLTKSSTKKKEVKKTEKKSCGQYRIMYRCG